MKGGDKGGGGAGGEGGGAGWVDGTGGVGGERAVLGSSWKDLQGFIYLSLCNQIVECRT